MNNLEQYRYILDTVDRALVTEGIRLELLERALQRADAAGLTTVQWTKNLKSLQQSCAALTHIRNFSNARYEKASLLADLNP